MDRMPLVGDLMDRHFPTVTPDTQMKEAVDLLVKKNLIGMLVVDGEGELRGILSEKDCLKIILNDGFYQLPDDTVEHYMHPPPAAVRAERISCEWRRSSLETTSAVCLWSKTASWWGRSPAATSSEPCGSTAEAPPLAASTAPPPRSGSRSRATPR